MREGWKKSRLGDECCIVKKKHNGSPLPYIGMECIESGTGQLALNPLPKEVKSSTFYFNGTHVLYGRLRPYLNKVFLPDFAGHCSTEIFPIECGPKLHRDFLFYWLTSPTTVSAIDRTSTGARMPRANVNAILDFNLPLPPLPEQKRIVAILDETFEGIAKAVANTEKNLANARELFEGYLDSVFRRQGQEWPREKFGDICNFVRGPFGGSLKKSCFVSDGFAVYEQQHAINNQFSVIRYYIDDKKFDEMARFELKSGDLIMSCSGTMGKVAIAPSDIKRGIINQALLKLSPSNKIDAQFLKFWMEHEGFMDEIKKHSKGVAIKNVASVKVLKEIRVPCPSIDVQQIVVETLEGYCDKANELESTYQRKLAALAELKQSLLQKAFSGELTAGKKTSLKRAIKDDPDA